MKKASNSLLQRELCNLELMKVGQLTKRYEQLIGEPCRSRNKQYIVRRIAWRLQANAEGGLSERAKRRIEELADDAEIRVTPPKNLKPKVATSGAKTSVLATGRDTRLPPPGNLIQRVYKGNLVQVIVQADGFEFDGKKFKTLSSIAKSVTGSHVNGFKFFQLGDAK